MTPPRALLWVVCAISMMSTIGMAMPYPILAPIFVQGAVDGFTHFMGLPPKLLMGIALAANPLGILIGSLFIGPLSDRHGRRRTLLWTLSLTVLSSLLGAWALDQRWYALFVGARFLTGLTEGNLAVARAVLADLHPVLDRTRSFAWLNASNYAGWLLGPLLGGLTLPLGEPVPFVLAGLALLPCLLVIWRALPETRARSAAAPGGLMQQAMQHQALGLLRQDKLLARLFALQLAYTLGLTTCYEFYPLWLLENAGLGSLCIAWVTAGLCLVMSLASMLVGRFDAFSSRGHALRRASACALMAAAGLMGLALLPGTAGLLVIIAMGLPLALYNAVLPAWVSERFAHHGQGRVMGLLTVIFYLANVVTALVGGALSLLDTRWIMAVGGACSLWAAWSLLRLARDVPTSSIPSTAAAASNA